MNMQFRSTPFGNNDFFNGMGSSSFPNYMSNVNVNDNFNQQMTNPPGSCSYSSSMSSGGMGTGQGKMTSIKKTTQLM